MKNLLFINNLNVYKNALSAIDYYNVDKKDCILIVSSFQEINLRRLFEIIDFSLWYDVFVLYFNQSQLDQILSGRKNKRHVFRYFIGYNSFFKKFKYINDYNLVITGFYKDFLVNSIVNSIKYNYFIHVDEGNKTLSAVNLRWLEVKSNRFIPEISNDFKSLLLFRLFNMFTFFKVRPIEKVIFFTIYNIKLPRHDVLISNRIPLNLTKNAESNFVLVIGSASYKRGNITLETYLDIIEYTLKYYKGKEIFYYQHPYENINLIKNFFPQLKINTNKEPIEDFLLNLETLPKNIVITYSSAFFNIYNMFGEIIDFNVVDISNEIVNSKKRDQVKRIYEQIEMLSNNNENVVINKLK